MSLRRLGPGSGALAAALVFGAEHVFWVCSHPCSSAAVALSPTLPFRCPRGLFNQAKHPFESLTLSSASFQLQVNEGVAINRN